jgi:hypothetical protein
LKDLAIAIAEKVAAHVATQAGSLTDKDAEYRAVFNGPPTPLLANVLNALLNNAGGISVTLPNNTTITIPVVMQVDILPAGVENPDVGISGICDLDHLLALRNSRTCPQYIVLVSPVRQANISQTSTRTDFGLAAANNSSSATLQQWWHDPFIQGLVDDALEAYEIDPNTVDEAKRLVEAAVRAANTVGSHDGMRANAWQVLVRLWSAAGLKHLPASMRISSVCGFPPTGTGKIDAHLQARVLDDLATRMEGGYGTAIRNLKEQASTPSENSALDAILAQVQTRCEVATALKSGMPYYYLPVQAGLDPIPDWWTTLTTEKWIELFDEQPTVSGALAIECQNAVGTQARGLTPFTKDEVRLTIAIPAEAKAGLEVTVVRNAKSATTRREWKVTTQGPDLTIVDDLPPQHKIPLVYTVQADGLKSSSTKVISLAGWVAGFITCARTASKTSVPKAILKNGTLLGFELSMMLNGEGRHYVDVFTAPGFSLVKAGYMLDDDSASDTVEESSVHRVDDGEYGLEVIAIDGRTYRLEILQPDGKTTRTTMNLSCDEVDTETCSSEFERLIRLNRREGKRGTTEVHVNRQVRCSDLQTWMLDDANVGTSFYPAVLAPDYATRWRKCDWRSAGDTVFSQGKFVHDPRPSFDQMTPPAGFLELRQKIARRIRGADGDGLVESAKLGEWLVTDSEFFDEMSEYLRLYLNWLSESPDMAAWCDIALACQIEADGTTLSQEPDALIITPLHPIRLAWHCIAQQTMFNAQKTVPCPAASVLDPDCIPDILALPLMTPSGVMKERIFLAVECSSDYWGVLWNGGRLAQLSSQSDQILFSADFGLVLGGIASGFSVSQVHRALNDLSEMFVAKPILNILVSSAAGQNNACNEGIISWCRSTFEESHRDGESSLFAGPSMIQILDERKPNAFPAEAEIANLSEDTNNSVRWYSGTASMLPDLGIIAQLELSNVDCADVGFGSPISYGGLIRSRLREQWKVTLGVMLCESRVGVLPPQIGNELGNRLGTAIAHLENLATRKYGYQFAPSPHAIESVLKKADFAAVSSSTVDPACFLTGWLDNAYLWDYSLPSYSSRADDTNGYYLLSKIKNSDCESIGQVLKRLPGCDSIDPLKLQDILLEISRRGIPTIRGMSNGDSGASGDLGMFVASRLLQDEFRRDGETSSLLPVRSTDGGVEQVVLLIPVDPFKGYLEDMSKALSKSTSIQRPDLLVLAVEYTTNTVRCKITPVEVKFRGGELGNGAAAALLQAKTLSKLLQDILIKSNSSGLELWKIGMQHLMVSFINFAFRVYSQQATISSAKKEWSQLHARLLQSIYADETSIEIDQFGRLIVVDASKESGVRDSDADGFAETIIIRLQDAAKVVQDEASGFYALMREKLGSWDLLPTRGAIDISQVGHAQEIVPSELAAPPAPTNTGSEKFEKETVESSPDQQAASGILIEIGRTIDTFEPQERILDLSDTRLNQMNMGVVGDLGTGKTQLLKSLIAQIASAKEANMGVAPNILIFDYKKDYSSEEFVKAVGAKVMKPEHLPLNLFSLANAQSSVAPWLSRYKFFADVLEKIFPNVGHVQLANLRDAIKKSYEDLKGIGKEPTIYDIARNYEEIVPKRDSISSILTDMVDMELFSPDADSGQGFDQFLDGVVVLSLNLLGQDDRTKNMLVAIMLNMFYERMLKVPKRPYYGVSPQRRVVDSFLLVDEADNIMKYQFDVLRKLLLEGREFGMGVILASQYLSHFKVGATDYREPLLTWFIHKVPSVSPAELSSLGMEGTLVPMAERIKSLKLHECLYKTHDITGEIVKGLPFYLWNEVKGKK